MGSGEKPITAGRLLFVGVVLSLLIAFVAVRPDDPAPVSSPTTTAAKASNAAAVIDDLRAFEAKWLAAKGKKDGEIAHYEYATAIARIGMIPESDQRKAEAVAIGDRLKVDEALIRKMSDATYDRWAKRDEANRKADAIKRDKENLPIRRQYGKAVEKFFLDQGMDVYVTIEGPEARTLRLKYILMSRPLAHQISNNVKTLDTWRALGFRTVVLTDGYDKTWRLDLR